MRTLLNFTAFYLRHSPIERGRWRLLRWALPVSRQLFTQREMRILTTRCRTRMRIDKGDWIGRHIFVSGEYEPSTTSLMTALLRPGDVMLDIGANIGYFTLLAAREVGSEGQVIAFEPMPRTRKELAFNVQLNGLTNVMLRSEAAFNVDGKATFCEGPVDHPGISSLRHLNQASNQIEVETARLDSLLPADQKVSLVKIDVEGAEFQVIDGMRGHLARTMPDLIIEVTDEYLRGLGHSALELCELLLAIGYRMYEIAHDRLVPISDLRQMPSSQFNALFSRRTALPTHL